MSPENKYQPEFVEEAEVLLGMPFFTNEADYNITDYAREDLGLRAYAYQACCRVLAAVRHHDRPARADLKESVGEAHMLWNNRWEHTLTPRRIGEIAVGFGPALAPIAKRLAMTQVAERYVTSHWEELQQQLDPPEQACLTDIVHTLRGWPRSINYETSEAGNAAYTMHGATIMTPPEANKAKLVRACIALFEPGVVPPTPSGRESPARVTVVLPSVELARQATDSLTKQFSDIRVGRLFSGARELDADIIVTNTFAFHSYIQKDKFWETPLDVVIFDGADYFTGPKLREAFVTQWRGPSLIFTTPEARPLNAPMQAVLPHGFRSVPTVAAQETLPVTENVPVRKTAKIPRAKEDELTITRIIELAGVEPNIAHNHLTAAEWNQGHLKRYKTVNGSLQVRTVWPADAAQQMVEHLKQFPIQPLEAHLIPWRAGGNIVAKIAAVQIDEAVALLASGGYQMQTIMIVGRRGVKTPCITWSALAWLQAKYGLKTTRLGRWGPKPLELDYNNLPTGIDDSDPAKIAYAQSIQAKFLKPEQLRDYTQSKIKP